MDSKNTVSNGISASIVREIASFIMINRGQEFDLSRARKAGFTQERRRLSATPRCRVAVGAVWVRSTCLEQPASSAPHLRGSRLPRPQHQVPLRSTDRLHANEAILASAKVQTSGAK